MNPASSRGQAFRQHSAMCLVIAVACVLAACSGMSDDTRTLRVGHTLEVAHPVHEALEFMAKDLAERSDGAMTLIIYSSGQLGSEREMIELLQVGALDMTKVSASPLEGFAAQMGVFGLPYLFRDNQHFWEVLEGAVGQELLSSMGDKRLVGLGYFDAGSRSFYTKGTPVITPADIKGKKVRVMNSRMAIDTMAAMGASATPIPGGEVYTALQQGVVDAAENNPPTYYSSRHFEVAPYYSLDEHASIPDVILLSASTQARLSDQQRVWLSQSMQRATDYQRSLWTEATDEALRALEREGVAISYPEKAPFVDSVAEIYSGIEGTELGALARRVREVGADE